MGCIACGRGFHDECDTGCNVCHPAKSDLVKVTRIGTGSVGRPLKNPEDVTDKYSTGRKRAAKLWPIFKDKPCEWQGKKNVGGGQSITGCINGMQRDRHHGPIKEVLRNEPGNVHRICTVCHTRWHAVNDPVYDETEYEKLKHNPEEATEMELITNEAKWRLDSEHRKLLGSI